MVFHLYIPCNYCWFGSKQLSFDTIMRPCALQLSRHWPMHRHSCSLTLQVYSLGSNSLSGKTFQNLPSFR